MPDSNPLISHPPPDREIKCVVSCQAADGRPSFYPIRVRCTQKQQDDGGHYRAAREACDVQQYTNIGLVYDENDGPQWLHMQFDWSRVDVRSAESTEPYLYRLLLEAADRTGKSISADIKNQLDQIATAIQDSDPPSDDDESCDECGAAIPTTPGGSLPNKHHHPSCSLYDSRQP
jgi:hypothetical protein